MYVNDYASEVKELSSKYYTWGWEDVLKAIWARIEWMEKNRYHVGASYPQFLANMKEWVDRYYETQGFDRPIDRARMYAGRMKNLDAEVECLTQRAILAGYLQATIKEAV